MFNKNKIQGPVAEQPHFPPLKDQKKFCSINYCLKMQATALKVFTFKS